MSFSHLLDPVSDSNTFKSSQSTSPRPPTPIPYDPTHRISTPSSLKVPISEHELDQCKESKNPLRTRPPPFREPDYDSDDAKEVRNPFDVANLLNAASNGDDRKLPPSGPAALPKRPADPETSYQGGQRKRRKSNEDVKAVASHYNARPEIGVQARSGSPIIGLKNFNNWVKSVLIGRFGRREGTRTPKVKVLDLGCGKGGDLLKWSRAGTDEYIGIDLAAKSIEQARERWEQMRGPRFKAGFFAHDCFNRSISDVLTSQYIDRPFDVVTMQFCMHYAFVSEENACMMLENVARYLRPGGTFIGTIPDASNLLSRLAAIDPAETDLTFGNEVYRITFEQRDDTPRFGHRYTFFLEDAVEAVPEYVVYWDLFEELASRYGLQVLYHASFQQIFINERQDPAFAQLLTRMKVVDSQGDTEMTFDQWEAANLYVGFALTKVDG